MSVLLDAEVCVHLKSTAIRGRPTTPYTPHVQSIYLLQLAGLSRMGTVRTRSAHHWLVNTRHQHSLPVHTDYHSHWLSLSTIDHRHWLPSGIDHTLRERWARRSLQMREISQRNSESSESSWSPRQSGRFVCVQTLYTLYTLKRALLLLLSACNGLSRITLYWSFWCESARRECQFIAWNSMHWHSLSGIHWVKFELQTIDTTALTALSTGDSDRMGWCTLADSLQWVWQVNELLLVMLPKSFPSTVRMIWLSSSRSLPYVVVCE